MRSLIGSVVGGIVIGLLVTVALGLLIAAAVVGFADLVGVGGALGIVGGGLVVVALVVAFAIQAGQRRRVARRRRSGLDFGEIVAGFLLGVWDGLSKPTEKDGSEDR